jgi:carboxylesterase type B
MYTFMYLPMKVLLVILFDGVFHSGWVIEVTYYIIKINNISIIISFYIKCYAGAAHNDDVNYVFPYLNAKFADLELFNTLGDKAIINTMCEMWTNFMKTG